MKQLTWQNRIISVEDTWEKLELYCRILIEIFLTRMAIHI